MSILFARAIEASEQNGAAGKGDHVRHYVEAGQWVRRSMREDQASIVCASILSALEGRCGAHHSTDRTSGNTVWINPLMTFYWCCDINAIAERVLYLDRILATDTYAEVRAAIEGFRKESEHVRMWSSIPL